MSTTTFIECKAMEQHNVLLFDLHTPNHLGHNLAALLREKACADIELHYEIGSPRDSTWGFFRKQLASLEPDITFLIFGSGLPAQGLRTLLGLCADGGTNTIVVTEEGNTAALLDALTYGANDFLISPLRGSDLYPRISKLLARSHFESDSIQVLKEKLGLRQFIGESKALLKVLEKIPLVARFDAGVLLSGATGTGKEVCARAIHHLSPRSGHPFVPLNCGAIPSELIENELFGHAAGAYTSAATGASGLVEHADGGTLFLDEVDTLTLSAQAKFLRFLQEKEYRPVGSSRTCKSNVRVIAATNANLQDAVASKRFREDLYYRLNIVELSLPPLRERGSDIGLLANHFLKQYSQSCGRGAKCTLPRQPFKSSWSMIGREMSASSKTSFNALSSCLRATASSRTLSSLHDQ